MENSVFGEKKNRLAPDGRVKFSQVALFANTLRTVKACSLPSILPRALTVTPKKGSSRVERQPQCYVWGEVQTKSFHPLSLFAIVLLNWFFLPPMTPFCLPVSPQSGIFYFVYYYLKATITLQLTLNQTCSLLKIMGLKIQPLVWFFNCSYHSAPFVIPSLYFSSLQITPPEFMCLFSFV